MPDLTEVPVQDLLEEVQRRMLCALKPQKRVILIGGQQPLHHAFVMHAAVGSWFMTEELMLT